MLLADAASTAGIVTDAFIGLASMAAIIGGIIGFFKWQRQAGAKAQRQDDAADIVFGKEGEPNVRQLVEMQTKKLDTVYANMLPNGGKSMRDDIKNINNNLNQLIGEVRAHYEQGR